MCLAPSHREACDPDAHNADELELHADDALDLINAVLSREEESGLATDATAAPPHPGHILRPQAAEAADCPAAGCAMSPPRASLRAYRKPFAVPLGHI